MGRKVATGATGNKRLISGADRGNSNDSGASIGHPNVRFPLIPNITPVALVIFKLNLPGIAVGQLLRRRAFLEQDDERNAPDVR